MKIDLDLVPFRETGMNAYEAMLSESQERMLVVPKKGKETELVAIFEKWNLNAVQIGEVTGDGMIEIHMGGKLKARIPAESLVLGGGAPRYERETKRPSYLDAVKTWKPDSVPDVVPGANTKDVLITILGSWNVCSRKPITEQYDSEVGLVKLIGPGLDGGLSSIPDTNKALATATDCNSRYTYLDPYKGAQFAVCEAARNVYVTGATPYGVTNNLNFANPYIPENYYMFSECIRGMGDACRFLELPVTGGNVSFYNESPEGPIFPTPTIGMVGILQDKKKLLSNFPKEVGIELAVLGNFRPSLGGSEYLKKIHGQVNGSIPELDIEEELELCRLVLSLNEEGALKFARDLSLGGIGIALSKTVLFSRLGIQADLTSLKQNRLDLTLFGESSTAVLVGFDSSWKEKIHKQTEEKGLKFYPVGKTTASEVLELRDIGVEVSFSELNGPYENGLEAVFAL